MNIPYHGKLHLFCRIRKKNFKCLEDLYKPCQEMEKEFVFMRNVIIKNKEYIVRYCSEDIKNGKSSKFSLIDINLVFTKVSQQYIFNKRYFCNMCFKKLMLSIIKCVKRLSKYNYQDILYL